MQTFYSNFYSVIKSKAHDYLQLMKCRLTMLVVFSSVIGFVFGSQEVYELKSLFLLVLGGSLVTFASNAINQLIERDTDKLMNRTMNRPLPQNRLSLIQVLLFIGLNASIGLALLAIFFNSTTAFLSALSLIVYGFLYTPLKRIHSIAVFVGAIPGALPPLIGYIAATNNIDINAIWLFFVQFFWQFPHFWSIAWVSFDDYKKAGIMLLPSLGGKDKSSTIIIFIYTLVLVPLSLLPLHFDNVGHAGVFLIFLSSILFSYQAFRLVIFHNDIEAKKLMFYSFGYLLIFLGSIFL